MAAMSGAWLRREGAPSLTRRSIPLDHVFCDTRLRACRLELEQFAMDARRAPQRVFYTHVPDQSAQLCLNLRPPSKRARLPTPVPTKGGPMPTHERLGTDDRDNLQDRGKPSIQLDKKPSAAVRNSDTPLHHYPAQHNHLVTERSIFGIQVGSST